MATTISAALNFNSKVIEVLDPTLYPGVKNNKITHTAFDVGIALDGTTTPPVVLLSEQTLTGASGTLDLTSLTTFQGARSCTGMKLRYLRVNNRGTHSFTIAVGASNGYAIGGASIVVQPGGAAAHYFKDGLTAVDGTHKTLDWTLFAAESADLTLIFG